MTTILAVLALAAVVLAIDKPLRSVVLSKLGVEEDLSSIIGDLEGKVSALVKHAESQLKQAEAHSALATELNKKAENARAIATRASGVADRLSELVK